MLILCLCSINRRRCVLPYERVKNGLFSSNFTAGRGPESRVFKLSPISQNLKKLLKLLMVFLKILHYRGYLGKIWRNSKFHDWRPILHNFGHRFLICFHGFIIPGFSTIYFIIFKIKTSGEAHQLHHPKLSAPFRPESAPIRSPIRQPPYGHYPIQKSESKSPEVLRWRLRDLGRTVNQDLQQQKDYWWSKSNGIESSSPRLVTNWT